MKVLIVGAGGREHALAWKVSQSSKVGELYCAPGNAGIAGLATQVGISESDVDSLCKFVLEKDIDLTIIGPEIALANGLADRLLMMGRRVFGPTAAAARLESSKNFAKQLMQKYGIPTAEFAVFDDCASAIEYVKHKGVPLVIKADGLAAGKGVKVVFDEEDAFSTINEMLNGQSFGSAGSRVVIEEFLQGEEVSILAFCDGSIMVPMVSAQDHKRAFDNDQGPNTGGMGAYSPAPVYTPEIASMVKKEVFDKVLYALDAESIEYKGVIYAGLMICGTEVKVLEFNCRFGDPETQVILPRLKTDLIEIIEAVIDGKLDQTDIFWSDQAAVCVVMASGGYPGAYQKGFEIRGLQTAAEKALVFHAGTQLNEGRVVTNGGRVLGITALGGDIAETIKKVYAAAGVLEFEGCFYRRDIAYKALKKV